jgi:hypothetical protein
VCLGGLDRHIWWSDDIRPSWTGLIMGDYSFIKRRKDRQCPSGRYWRGTWLCGCSFASNCGWVRAVWVRGDGAGASRPGAVALAVTPRLRGLRRESGLQLS